MASSPSSNCSMDPRAATTSLVEHVPARFSTIVPVSGLYRGCGGEEQLRLRQPDLRDPLPPLRRHLARVEARTADKIMEGLSEEASGSSSATTLPASSACQPVIPVPAGRTFLGSCRLPWHDV